MQSELLTYRGVVYPWHCDHMGHMNVTWYTAKFDEATWQFFSQIGITAAYLRDNHRGMAAVKQVTEYKRELLAGDVVSIHSGLLEIRSKVIRFYHLLFNDGSGEIAARTELTGVHIDALSRKATSFPETILEKARKFFSET